MFFLPDDVVVNGFNLSTQRNESDAGAGDVRGRFRYEGNPHTGHALA